MVARGGLAETLEDLEAQLALYVEEMWEAGDSRADASTLVAAVQFFSFGVASGFTRLGR